MFILVERAAKSKLGKNLTLKPLPSFEVPYNAAYQKGTSMLMVTSTSWWECMVVGFRVLGLQFAPA